MHHGNRGPPARNVPTHPEPDPGFTVPISFARVSSA